MQSDLVRLLLLGLILCSVGCSSETTYFIVPDPDYDYEAFIGGIKTPYRMDDERVKKIQTNLSRLDINSTCAEVVGLFGQPDAKTSYQKQGRDDDENSSWLYAIEVSVETIPKVEKHIAIYFNECRMYSLRVIGIEGVSEYSFGHPSEGLTGGYTLYQ